ncbi:MAG: bifunctional phosphopantothenoylcysteine decarboxylase/phosphopantothenate--cysteine ligase CoaBC [Nitrospirae bacterium]|nr:bifunctional phosphopantothenoylcysteine decarboxylase/phosphopantothenate--cysteine ligase CoaBC [Nitrospirota bacterium]
MLDPLRGKKIVLGVTGSISAYKSAEIVRRLRDQGADVVCVMTPEAQRFIAPLTLQALSRNRVHTDLFRLDDQGAEMPHLSLAQESDLILIAPATAHTLAKMALGLCDDLLSTLLAAARVPVVAAPAMDIGMIDHPAVQKNISILRERGIGFVGPDEGPLASGAVGPGRLAAPGKIVEAVTGRLYPKKDLAGLTILVSAGPTREAIDPVRYLSNRSSGKMGYALAKTARWRGAEVILVSGPTALTSPEGIERVSVVTAREMAEAIYSRLDRIGVLIMAAAVADYRPEKDSPQKIKKNRNPLSLNLVENEDILQGVSKRGSEKSGGKSPRPIVVGFAAESQGLLEEAKRKLKEKDLDMIVANPILLPGAGFDEDTNVVTIIRRDHRTTEYPRMSKLETADIILDHLVEILPSA